MEKRRFPNWSSDEDERLRRMAAGGSSKRDVARILGRTVNAVAARAVATRVRFLGRADRHWGTQVVRRRCLRCHNLFDSPSRFRFVCDLCHALEEWRGADLG